MRHGGGPPRAPPPAHREAVEARRPGDVMALAHHYAAAGQTAKAFEHTLRAAEQAFAQLAHDQAAELYGRALELLEDGSDPGARCDTLIALGDASARR